MSADPLWFLGPDPCSRQRVRAI
uniref:Uncharacterized protein n=1 Tax=Anguilla anguilla TaxID=7936 RepID=A0A0E9UTR1_ANGAN